MRARTGESGTGKESVARTVHRLSTRGKKPFLPINRGAIPPTLIESEVIDADSLHVKPRQPGPVASKTIGPTVPGGVGMSLAEVEQWLITATLDHFDGDVKKTAVVRGVCLKTLYNGFNSYSEAG